MFSGVPMAPSAPEWRQKPVSGARQMVFTPEIQSPHFRQGGVLFVKNIVTKKVPQTIPRGVMSNLMRP